MNESLPLVSIIVPVYNKQTFLTKCIDSILSQSYQNIELILIDDGSNDFSGNICDDYAIKDSRVKVFHQENSGVSKARFNGVKVASGDWGFFVDSDDFLPSNAIEVLVKNSEGFDLICGGIKFVNHIDNEIQNPPKHISEIGEFNGVTFVNQLLYGRRFASLCRQLIRMEIMKKYIVLFPKEIKICEDLLLNLQLGQHLKKVKGISDNVYFYNYYENNTINTYKLSFEDFLLIDKQMEFLLDNKPNFINSFYQYRISYIKNHIDDDEIINSAFFKKTLSMPTHNNDYIKKRILKTIFSIKNTRIRVLLWNVIKASYSMKNSMN